MKNMRDVIYWEYQQKLKTRVNQHLAEVCALVNKNKTSNSFVRHFAAHSVDIQDKLTIGEARSLVEMNIEWQGKPISCNKSFGKLNSPLCVRERLVIFEHSKKDPTTIINTSNGFYGACRHKPKFHRYPKSYTTLSTDDKHNSSERVEQDMDSSPDLFANNSLPVYIYIDPPTCVEIDTTNNSEENLTVTCRTNNMVKNHDLFYMDV